MKILSLLFGDNESIHNDENDNHKTLFADPFHNNNSQQITLSLFCNLIKYK